MATKNSSKETFNIFKLLSLKCKNALEKALSENVQIKIKKWIFIVNRFNPIPRCL